MDKLPLTSKDVLAEKIARIREEFPEVFSEGKIDFERLKMAIGEFVDNGRERYGLTWAGKSEAIRNIQTPSVGTLLPVPEESVNFETSENLIIEGDNLEVLKLLQKSYHGQIKMIYIDPPYNTGNEFIYPDNFREGLEDYLRYSGQVDSDGIKLSTNTETDGRFHSKWLNMMYPRLFLARNLLKDDGVIFVSIDDHEVKNLRCLMDEIFGEENFFASFSWQSRQSVQNDTDMSVSHEYIVGYAKRRRHEHRRLKESNQSVWWDIPEFAALPLPLDPERFSNPDNDPRGPWKADPFDAPNVRPNLTYAIKNPNTGEEYWPPAGRCWRTDEESYKKLLSDNRIVFGTTGQSRPQLKVFYHEKKDFGSVATTWLSGDTVGTATHGTRELQGLFDGQSPFDTVKPTALIKFLCQIATRQDDIVLDFFAGSGTTGHAVLAQNLDDGANRKFIMVQLPETTENESFPRISDITTERMRRAIQVLSQSSVRGDAENLELGFRLFRLSSSNFKTWESESTLTPGELAQQLRLFADNLLAGRSQQDILYEIVLKSGLPLTASIAHIQVGEQSVFSISDGALLICLEDIISENTLRNIVGMSPRSVVCLDTAFHGNDNLKTNTKLLMESHDIEFHTV
ncbi:adenine-specific DNA-methyltransferase [Alicyclobacillus sacchari]|uniref:Adenine-specific DNA-methyltransferase n=1 Tax=Alicyclobacillus sacchari TaxID=392010 RepID=A0A4R8L8L7_9BACL|nr:site-specific DNA-methyltransferase [Alicyclobacillus sacchari]TDY39083.1 adenine-specific DNA-methyltransferase [Alicyclobacillus sacchari]